MQLLELQDASTGYERPFRVLESLSLELAAGRTVGIIGRNGVGKSTLVRVLRGVQPLWGGRVFLDGCDISRYSPRDRLRAGLATVPEGRGVFKTLSVLDNLEIAGFAAGRRDWRSRLVELFALFPELEGRATSAAGTLSGGEQQMLAIARALLTGPRLLVMDEPSLGLSPSVIRRVEVAVRNIVQTGIGVLVAEQNYQMAVSIADTVLLMDGRGGLRPLTKEELHDAHLVGKAMLGG